MSIGNRLILLSVLFAFFLTPDVQAQNPDDGFECNPMPIPTRPVGPTVTQTWDWFGAMYDLTAWRYPCSKEFSYVMLTVVPLDNQDPFLCSAQIILAQGDSNLDDSPGFTQDPYFNQPSWCQELVLPTSFALIPRDDESPINFQDQFVVHWDTGREDQQFEMFAYDPSQYSVFGDTVFRINEGLNDAWYNKATDGQGFFITVFPEIRLMFLSWFTFDTQRPPDDVQANLGDPGHRWITAQGPYDGSRADLTVNITTGGVFNSPLPIPQSHPDGNIRVDFEDCNSGTVTFHIPSIDKQGAVPIERITLDLVPVCEQLDGVSK